MHQLLAAGLVDEVRLLVFPVVIGAGKRFIDDRQPAAWRVAGASTARNGVVRARYEKAGDVATGSFVAAQPTAAAAQRHAAP